MRCINLPAKPCRPWTGTDIVHAEIKLKENCENPRENLCIKELMTKIATTPFGKL